MSNLIRFGVSLEKELLSKFDSLLREKGYLNRSEAIRDIIRENLVRKEWLEGKDVNAVITLVYDHHKRELVNRLTDIQHDFHEFIISGQHVHMDKDNCLEIIVVKGNSKKIKSLAYKLKSIKGVKHSSLTMATTGKDIP